MPQHTDIPSIEQALESVRGKARQYRANKRSAAARTALHEAVVLAVRAGAKQAGVAEASGLSKAQVSRVARGGTSGNSQLPPAEYLIDTLPADEVIKRYRAGETAKQLSQVYGCSSTTIRTLLERHNVSRRDGRTIELPVSNEELARRYLHERAEVQQLAAEFGLKAQSDLPAAGGGRGGRAGGAPTDGLAGCRDRAALPAGRAALATCSVVRSLAADHQTKDP